MTFILCIALIGMRGETVVQITLLITLSASLLNFFIGSLLPVTDYKRRHGFEGYSCKFFFFFEKNFLSFLFRESS
jgi:hypothetical protein